jgi:hypothetical protein
MGRAAKEGPTYKIKPREAWAQVGVRYKTA